MEGQRKSREYPGKPRPVVAMRIRELMETEQVLDKKTETYRPVCYSDFTILLRTMSGWAETFKKILNSCGIPVSVTTKTGYFSAPEVTSVLDYLQILDNPLQDIPLAGALRSMPQSFSFEELAEIKILGKEAESPRFMKPCFWQSSRTVLWGKRPVVFLRFTGNCGARCPIPLCMN